MSLTAYQKGYLFERRVRRQLESEGYTVFRTAGSRADFDLVALKAGEPPLLVQCKVNPKLSEREKERLCETAGRAGGVAVLAYRERRRIKIEKL